MVTKKQSQKGFVLLMSSIVISVILVAVVFSLSFGGFFTRFNLLDSYNKEASLALAEACANIAVLKHIQNNSYLGNETLSVGTDACQVLPFQIVSGETVIKTTAVKGGATTNVQVNLSPDLEVVRWREVASF